MSKWDERFLAMAHLVASWSKDTSTQVGAVIVDDKNRVVSVGFNGFPRGVQDDAGYDREEKLYRTIHAEENALLFARGSVENCTIYVTHPPCGNCAAKLIQSGIAAVVVSRAIDEEFEMRWAAHAKAGRDMMHEAGVEVRGVIK